MNKTLKIMGKIVRLREGQLKEIIENVINEQDDSDPVTYWDLIRSYLKCNYSNKIVMFSASDMNNSNDFLHYSYVIEFDSEEEMNNFYNEEKDDGTLMIRSIKGNIID